MAAIMAGVLNSHAGPAVLRSFNDALVTHQTGVPGKSRMTLPAVKPDSVRGHGGEVFSRVLCSDKAG